MNLKRSTSREKLLPETNAETKFGYGSATENHVAVTIQPHHARLGDSGMVTGSTLTVHNVQYTVDVKSRPCCGVVTKKHILKGIDGIFRPGMNAILGPTGSGKSSLLDILAGRKDPRFLKGTLLIDGNEPPDNFKCMVGYVVQDDVVLGTLTVRENFQFSATLRLDKSVTKAERDDRVDTVIQELGLTDCADTKVGTEFIRGVSGGERKRTNIGMELIISPPILFLDEPTTGLDASTANAVMFLLKRLALKGRTIVFSIHQPRYSIYRLFDSLVILSLGESVYQGPAKQALDYFKDIGYICEEHNNPADFFLDVVNGDSTAITSKLEDVLKKSVTEGVSSNSISPMAEEVTGVHEKLANAFTNSSLKNRLIVELNPIIAKYHETRNQVPKRTIGYATGFLRQLSAVSGRTVKNLLRNPQTSILQVFVMVIFATIVGAIYFQIDKSCVSGIQNRVGAFFFIVMNQVFGNLSAVELFIKERTVFMHENVSGFYRVSAYFLAKVFCDVLPMRLFPVLVFAAITYWMIGFQVDVAKFFIYVLSLFLCTLTASGVAFLISASVKIFAIANLLIALCYVFMMVFSGLLVNLADMAQWLQWLKWFSIFRYALNALDVNELKGMEFLNENGTSCVTPTFGDSYLIAQGIPYETDWDLWQNMVAMGSMTLIFMILAYIQLRRLNKLR